jgi:hypothetical protein
MPPIFLFNMSVLQESHHLHTLKDYVICLKIQYTHIKPSMQIHTQYTTRIFQLLKSHEQKPLTNDLVNILMISTLEEAVGPKPEDRPMTVSKLIEGV